MSDNITREPYRNAWYKQLADAVKKHNEEIAEMRPHLVPDVEEGDNGKILIAGEEGAFDWGQPPEELPVITEGDEGKVLKVDEGVPKWLEDKDAEIPSHTASDEGKMLSVNAQNALEWKDVPDEYLVVTVTNSGGTYIADKTFAEILPYAEKGKCIAICDNIVHPIYYVTNTTLIFLIEYAYSSNGNLVDSTNNKYFLNYIIKRSLTFTSSGVTVKISNVNSLVQTRVTVTNGMTLSDVDYKSMLYTMGVYSICYNYNGKLYFLQRYSISNSDTEFDFVNYEIGIKAHIDANKLVTITEIAKDLFVTLTQSGSTYTSDYTFAQIKNALESGRNVIVKIGTSNYTFYSLSDTTIKFNKLAISNTQIAVVDSMYYTGLAKITQEQISITESSITKVDVHYFNIMTREVTDGSTLSTDDYNTIKAMPSIAQLINNYSYYTLAKTNSAGTEFDYVNVLEGKKIHIDANRLVTITTI